MDAALNERAFRYFRQLSEHTARKAPPLPDLASFEQVLWFGEAPLSPGCFSIMRDGPDEIEPDLWLRICRLPEPAMPPPPEACRDWYRESQLLNASAAPELVARLRTVPGNPVRGTPDCFAELKDHPEVETAWFDYLLSQWTPWAQRHRSWQAHHSFHTALCAAERALREPGANRELVVAFGLLTWARPELPPIRRHLVALRASLRFEAASGTIELKRFLPFEAPALEWDVVDPALGPPRGVTSLCEKLLAGAAVDVWAPGNLAPAVMPWVHALDDLGAYSTALLPPAAATSQPVVTFAPAIILRRRGHGPMVRFLDAVAASLRSRRSEDIPSLIRELCEAPEGAMPPPAPHEAPLAISPPERRRLVMDAVRNQGGIALQGPAGSDRFRTIADLVLHLLAEGKRILITGQCESDLLPVLGHLPAGLEPLCMAWLAPYPDARKTIEAALLALHRKLMSGSSEAPPPPEGQLENETPSSAEPDHAKLFSLWPLSECQDLLRDLERLEAALAAVRTNAPAWTVSVLHDVLRGEACALMDLYLRHETAVGRLRVRSVTAKSRQIVIPAGMDRSKVRSDASTLLAHVQEGGGFGFGPFRARPVRQALYLLRSVRLDGHPCDDEISLKDLVEHLTIEESRADLWRHIANVGGVGSDATTPPHDGDLDRTLSILRKIRSVTVMLERIRKRLAARPEISLPDWEDIAAVRAFRGDIEAAAAHVANERGKSNAAAASDTHDSARAVAQAWRAWRARVTEKEPMAIPALVVPISRLDEAVRTAADVYDVAIIVSADQCGPETCVVFYLASSIVALVDGSGSVERHAFADALRGFGAPVAIQ